GPRSVRSAALLLALLVPAAVVVAQSTYIETFEVRLQNLDVVVTDGKGKPVRGLTKEDFVVVENGEPQKITNFAIYDAGAGTATSNAAGTDARGEGEPESVVSAPPPRRVVFFVDELGVQRMARNRLYDSVKQFVDAMRPGDVAAVVRPTTQEKIVQEFTGDRTAIETALKAAIEDSSVEFSGPKMEVTNLRWQLKQARSPQDVRQAKREYADAAARRVEHRLGQIRALTSSLGGVEGKKIVVVVTMGLSAKPGSEAWDYEETTAPLQQPGMLTQQANDPNKGPVEVPSPDDPERIVHPVIRDLTPAIRDIARTAAANGVTIYAIEPDVPLELGVRASASVGSKVGASQGGDSGPDPISLITRGFQTDFLQNGAVTLTSLTEPTGGRWFRGLSNIDDTFRQVSEDLSFYYSLAYRATGQAQNGRRVAVSIRNRPELRVRTRAEALEKSTESEMTDLVVASLLYPRTVNELGITVTPGTPAKDRGLFTVPLDVVIPLKNLTFLPADGGKYAASFDLHYAASGEKRDFGTGGMRQQKIELTPEQYAAVGTTTYRYKTGIQVSPGRARIAIGVLDLATKLTGFRTVEVVAQ
ncbi:MAG TPA: VWA domain-containing protein, partial [Thermoanaerobaculia bacterium]|nr:VWA domain-containing protein [Thermoanaerobaculia bacterium]